MRVHACVRVHMCMCRQMHSMLMYGGQRTTWGVGSCFASRSVVLISEHLYPLSHLAQLR